MGNTNNNANAYSNTGAIIYQYKKMLCYDRIDASEEIYVNKLNKPKEYMIFHYWYFVDLNYTQKPDVCNGCNDVLMTPYELENITILNLKRLDYRCFIQNMARNDGINRLNNSKFDDKSSL